MLHLLLKWLQGSNLSQYYPYWIWTFHSQISFSGKALWWGVKAAGFIFYSQWPGQSCTYKVIQTICINCTGKFAIIDLNVALFTAAGLAQSVERLTAEREVAGSIPGAGPILRVLKITEKWRYFLCPASGWTLAWLGWPRKMAVPSPLGNVKYSVLISTFVLNTLTLNKVHFFLMGNIC